MLTFSDDETFLVSAYKHKVKQCGEILWNV